MTETNLEEMFSPFGQVISTRILRDNQGHSRGVGFARMESKEKCEQIIQTFNGQKIPGHLEPLTVKLADSGNKRRNQQQKQWVDRTQQDVTGLSPYDQATQNGGVATQGMTPPSMMQRYATHTPVTSYQIQGAAGSWLAQHPAQYIMQHPMPQQVIPTSVHPGSHMDPGSMAGMPQLAAQMSSLQLSAGTSYLAGPHGAYGQLSYPSQGTPILQAVGMEEHGAVTPSEDIHHYSAYGQAK